MGFWLVLVIGGACFVSGCSSVENEVSAAASASSPAVSSTALSSASTPSTMVNDSGTITTMLDGGLDEQVMTGSTGSMGNPDAPISGLEDGLTFDPAWRAEVTLACGRSETSRTVEFFDAETNDRGVAVLYRTWPSGGGFRSERAPVGSVIPVEDGLAWAIDGILLGPWDVDVVTDRCASE